MKNRLASIALAAALAQPAAATTFPTLTTIYVGPGVQDTTGASPLTAGTAVMCSNVSGATASVRFLFLNNTGGVAAQTTISMAHGASVNVATRNLTAIADTIVATGQINGGVVNVESTESGVFCSAMILDSASDGPNGAALDLVRVNPLPGTVE